MSLHPFILAERLWGSRRKSSSQDFIAIPPTNGSSALEDHSFRGYALFANNKLRVTQLSGNVNM